MRRDHAKTKKKKKKKKKKKRLINGKKRFCPQGEARKWNGCFVTRLAGKTCFC
jgi:hypothetical protein